MYRMDAHDLLAHLARRDDERAVADDLRATWAAFADAIAQQRRDQPWRQRAACRGMDVNLFHRDRSSVVNDAMTTCRRCPVSDECLAFALSLPDEQDRSGIYGGLTWQQRRELRRQREAA